MKHSNKKLMLADDFNARIGKWLPGEERVIGANCFGKRDQRGDLFLKCCCGNDLKIITIYKEAIDLAITPKKEKSNFVVCNRFVPVDSVQVCECLVQFRATEVAWKLHRVKYFDKNKNASLRESTTGRLPPHPARKGTEPQFILHETRGRNWLRACAGILTAAESVRAPTKRHRCARAQSANSTARIRTS
ncbi:unnamed protein product [Pieris brassicae]|uniref:Uncharacterized protein n=1 Tax=Pieris brassicae TaxID=7116 RepID=A0A9P0XH21_PIEBR|nr:unnamed protein product [Pieris brassicae]